MGKVEIIKSALKFLVQKQIEQGSHGFSDNDDDEVPWKEVLEWIEQPTVEMAEDCVKREDVKKFLYERLDRLNDDELYDIFSKIIDDMYNELPSVTPQPKRGKWISHREHCENLGVMASGLGAYEWCSNCDCGIDVKEFHRNYYDFCPNCGADMREVLKSECEDYTPYQHIQPIEVPLNIIRGTFDAEKGILTIEPPHKAEEQQPKRGKWIRITNGSMREKYICSECGRQIEEDGIEGLIAIKYPYCHCGAKMEVNMEECDKE